MKESTAFSFDTLALVLQSQDLRVGQEKEPYIGFT